MLSQYLYKIINGKSLDFEAAEDAMDMIMSGTVDEITMASFITALKMKGESVDEIAGFAVSMKKNAEKIEKSGYYIDTCGTGGDCKGMINVSTISAIIAASQGVKVAKHGNRAVSGKCGSADVLEKLGIKIDLPPKETSNQIQETGFGFLFAPIYHKAMKYAMPVRKKFDFPTIFNILGPLSNPASLDGQVLGVYRLDLVRPLIEVLKKIGLKKAMVVHGMDGSDEICACDETYVSELKNGEINEFYFTPRRRYNGPVNGDSPVENAYYVEKILENVEKGARRELVLHNASAAMIVSGIAGNMEEGYELANEVLVKKTGIDKINEIIGYQKKISTERA